MNLPHFSVDMVRWCSMHLINLGLDLWTCGSVFRCLLDETTTWGPGTDDDRLLVSYQEFKAWAKENRIVQLDKISIKESLHFDFEKLSLASMMAHFFIFSFEAIRTSLQGQKAS